MQLPISPDEAAELTRLLRTRVCAGCPHARPAGAPPSADVPRACESNCPIFQHLPTLLAYAENLDPLVGSFDGVVSALAGQCVPCGKGPGRTPARHRHDCPLEMHKQVVAEVLKEEARRIRREHSKELPHPPARRPHRPT